MSTDDSGAVDPLVSVDWLADHLEHPGVRAFDCTVLLSPDPNGSGTLAENGRSTYKIGHIPTSGFLDLLSDFADPDSPFRFTLPPADRFARKVGELGVNDTSTVVLYDRRGMMWATRAWMMFRAFSFRGQVAVLDGGQKAWTASGRALSTDSPTYAPASCSAELRPGFFTDKHDVLNGGACVVNALSAQQHRGEAGSAHYGRPGRIAGSANVPYDSLIDPATGRLRSTDELRTAFAEVIDDRRVITYCGGGIAASLDAFALHLLGRDDVSVYDASLMEWSTDTSLPMEVG